MVHNPSTLYFSTVNPWQTSVSCYLNIIKVFMPCPFELPLAVGKNNTSEVREHNLIMIDEDSSYRMASHCWTEAGNRGKGAGNLHGPLGTAA
jgi:hypothetical protein